MLKGTLLGVGGSDEIHEDVVLHDAGLQARLRNRAPGTPAQQHLTWGAVGEGTASPSSPWGPRGPWACFLPPPLAARLTFLGSPRGAHQRHLLAPSGHNCADSHEPLEAHPPNSFSGPKTMLPFDPGHAGKESQKELLPC